jgi:hypothetical protein
LELNVQLKRQQTMVFLQDFHVTGSGGSAVPDPAPVMPSGSRPSPDSLLSTFIEAHAAVERYKYVFVVFLFTTLILFLELIP